MTITYGDSCPIVRASATINNFDFEYGNDPATRNVIGEAEVLCVEASGRPVEFSRREGRRGLRRLVDANVLNTTSLTTFAFYAWPSASEVELVQFAYDIASFCSLIALQHTGVPVLSFLDGAGKVIKRIVVNAIESPLAAKLRDPVLTL